ncbi:RNA polymerase sigma factor [Halpernia humi]|uniref:RNA polymerase sigma factor n=1 Tax=Halpernia humi TaxID=493375 RepID=UPI0021D1AFBF|nr:RNA polymerase sigma factor [Halpernia humi]
MSFKEIFFLYQKMVYNLALQYSQNVEDAEEITQDVFVKISDKFESFKNQSKLKTWIYRIAINQSLDFIKAKNAQKRIFFSSIFRIGDEKNFYQPVNFDHPGAVLEQKEDIQEIFKAINKLTAQQKTVIILLKIEGNSQSETSEIMELSEKAVESLFQRAKKNLEIILTKNKGK